MTGLMLQLSGALVLRASGAVMRTSGATRLMTCGGWMLCMIAAWLAAGAAGAWSPLWPAPAVGVFFALLERNRARSWLRGLADGGVVTLAGLLSVPAPEPTRIGALLVMMLVAGALLDYHCSRARSRLRTTLLASPVVGVMLTGLVHPWQFDDWWRLRGDAIPPAQLLHVGVTPLEPGIPVVLRTGAAAWLWRPIGTGPHRGALLFHGANSAGSNQPAATVLQRALRDLDFVVLAVDHPGYGSSPLPQPSAGPEAWDPAPTALSALEMLEGLREIDGIYAFGHSMGSSEVLRLLALPGRLSGAVLLGSSMPAPEENAEYWYGRFHRDRRMIVPLPPDRVLEIRRRYYNNRTLVQALPVDHAPVLFVRFGIEWPNVVASRDALFDALPGRKERIDLATTSHPLHAGAATGLLVGDTRVVRRLKRALGGYLERERRG